MQVALTMISGNRKVGKIPVSTTEEDSCPNECPLHDTDCYARFGPLGMHWKKVAPGMRGSHWQLFCNAIKKFAKGQLWRHNQAGDLPKDKNGKIDAIKCGQLSEASKHTKGWTYTHYDPTDKENASVIEEMNKNDGMTVNLSADSLTEADQYYKLGIAPVTVILPKDAPKSGNKTPDGVPIVGCLAQTIEDMDCARCKLCQIKTRKSIVGFYAHGTASKRLSERLKNE